MAVHKNSATQQADDVDGIDNTSGANVEEKIDLSKAAPSGFGAVPFGFQTSDLSKQTEYLKQVFSEELERNKQLLRNQWNIDYKIHIVTSGKSGNPLISDAVAVSFSKDNKVVASSIILADADVPIAPLRVPAVNSNIYRGDTNLQIVRTMRDLDSKVYRSYLVNLIGSTYNESHVVRLERSTVISADLDKNQVDGTIQHGGTTPVNVQATVLRVIQSLMIKLGIELTNTFKDITIADVKALGGVIGLDVTQDRGNTTTFDGCVIQSVRKMTFHIRKEADIGRDGSLTRDVHNADHQNQMGSINLSTGVRHLNVQPVGNGNGGIGMGNTPSSPVYAKCWGPTIIIDSLEIPSHPSTGTVALMIATLAGFMTPEIMMSMFTTDIRYLSVISNITGKAKPEAVTKKAMTQNFREFYNAIMSDGFTIGLRIRPGTTSFITDVDWLKLASGDASPHILKHIQEMFGVKSVEPGDFISSHVDVHPTGTFPDSKGNLLPLSSFGIRYLLKEFPEETAMVREWLMASTTAMSREERLAVKTRIITSATGDATFTGMEYIVYFTGPVLSGLRDRLTRTLLLAPNNIMTAGFTDLSWASHGSGNIGMDFSQQSQNTGSQYM